MENTVANSLLERQKAEALARMQMLHMMGNVRNAFRKGKLYYSERQNAYFNAVLYFVDNNPDWAAKITEIEKSKGILVYHAQLTHTTLGDMLTLLYVSGQELEWESDRNALAKAQACAYVMNLDDPDCSEFGWVGIKPSMGGVVRTW